MNRKETLKSYRKNLGIFAVGLLWGIALTFLFGVIFMRVSLIDERESELSFDELNAKLPVEVQKLKGWTVQPVACGLPTPSDKTKIAVFKLCNRDYAQKMLDDPSSRKISSVIPCTFAIYEKPDGKAYIARMNVSLLGRLLGGEPGIIFPKKVTPEQEIMLKNLTK